MEVFPFHRDGGERDYLPSLQDAVGSMTTKAGKRLLERPWSQGFDLRADIDAIEADAVAAERERIVEELARDWLETGPWQNFDGFETAGDPYRRVLVIVQADRCSEPTCLIHQPLVKSAAQDDWDDLNGK